MSPGMTIVGLGPGNPAQLTLEAQQALDQAGEVYLRTAQHPTVAHLPPHLTVHAFDRIYQELDSFDQVYAEITRQVLALAQRPQGVCYAVPGHPLVAEATVQRLLLAAREKGLPAKVIAGLSFVEPVLTALGVSLLDGLQIVDALEVALRHHPPLNPDLPALLGQLYNRRIASDVKLTLMNLYPDDHPVHLVTAAGTAEEAVRQMPLHQLDRQEDIGHLSSLYVPPLPQLGSLNTFLEVVAHLRAPEGCPWDREQTHETLRSSLLEETYEVLEALDSEDPQALQEELGDLLLQIVLHTQIAAECNEFKMPDVAGHIIAKMKRRHPHVFGDTVVSGSAQVLQNWEKIKAAERKRSQVEGSLLGGVPGALPALARAQALQARAARVGFDWRDIQGVLAKVAEEMDELKGCDQEARTHELGDVLFSLVNLARWLEVDAESALRAANDRFTRRFRLMEEMAEAAGQRLQDLSLEEQDTLWERAKAVAKLGDDHMVT